MKTHLILLATALLPATLRAAPDAGSADYTAHEWGTFTSVQGADGAQMPWNPLNVVDLPKFVYSMAMPGVGRTGTPGILVAKTAFACRQRMETPVIYFYAKQPVRVDASIDFPQGRITEWYPQARFAEELTPAASARRPRLSYRNLRWQGIEILPAAPVAFIDDQKGSHYYAARETDANPVRVQNGTRAAETEKFLFYRGVADFTAPLTVTLPGGTSETVAIKNTGAQPLGHVFLYELRAGHARWMKLGHLSQGEARELRFDTAASPAADARATLGAALREALTSDGLYAREAAAMVKTWDDSWLGEPGLRVLYTLPAKWSDSVLPVKLSPAPREFVRVFVGRAEIIVPDAERALLAELDRFSTGDEAARAKAIASTRTLGLGRFLEPAMRRVLATPDLQKRYGAKSWELLSAASAR